MNEDINTIYYPFDDLGAIYTKRETKFSIWAFEAKEVELKIKTNDGFKYFPMERDDYGTYHVTVKGNLLNVSYHYLVRHQNDVIHEINDPYAKGVSLNSEYSAVVDYKSLNKKNKHYHKKTRCPIVYEVGIRDFTESKHTNIVNKGKYLGFIEKGRKTRGGNDAGLSYLLSLGVTHVQLNPIIDFANVDDKSIKTYNWGYDPTSLFSLEGSYSLHPEDPSSRLKEFKQLVDVLHKHNIKVILDVVYNHIFKYEDSVFEHAVPGYYFRKKANGEIANGSGCGNEFASEKRMVSKLIFDSAKYFIDIFDIDGFRFDLMGLIDVDTINAISDYAHSVKPDALIYGEGWNMGEALNYEARSCLDNYSKLHNVGFFNDHFRDNMNGNVFDINNLGYINGNVNNSDYIKYALLSSRFSYLNTINYIECHDNMTIFDRISSHFVDDSNSEILRRINFANAITLLSKGVAFIHMGQEIGMSKSGQHNTYNMNRINNFDYELLDKRMDMVTYFQDVAWFRDFIDLEHKNIHYSDFKVIDNKVLMLYFDHNNRLMKNIKRMIVILNPSNTNVNYNLGSYYCSVLSTGGLNGTKRELKQQNIIIPAASLLMFGAKDE